jgi:hypothetical protein
LQLIRYRLGESQFSSYTPIREPPPHRETVKLGFTVM